jgi:membrane protease YdiL (CAAX protease family)
VADVFLGIQLFIWLTLTAAIVVLVPLGLLFPRFFTDTEPRQMSVVMLLILLLQNAAMVATVRLFVSVKYRERLSAAGLSFRRWRRGLALGFVAALLILPVSDFLEQLTRYFLALAPPSPSTRLVEAMTRLVDIQAMLQPLLTPEWLGVLILVIGVIGPFGEEVFFRGFAYTAMKKRFGVAWAMSLSAILFSLIHTNPMAVVPIYFVGLLLAYLYERTGSLAAPFALHATNNTVAVLMLYFAPRFTFWGWLFPTNA